MNVITLMQSPNETVAPRLVLQRRPSPHIIRETAVQSPPLNPVFPFPFILSLSLCIVLCLSVPLQHRLGYYRLGSFSLQEDRSLESAMRLSILPDDTSLRVGADGERSGSDLPPEGVPIVSYSEYIVRRGDTISTIASRSGLRNISTILSANGISNARRIQAGQKLIIPSLDGIIHVVARGESITRLANRYSIPVTAILDANDLVTDTIVKDQRLFIPGGVLSTMELRRAMGELFVYPIRGRLTSPYGYRSDPFTGVRTFHTGIDLAAPTGSTVKVTLDGKVATTGYSAVYGNYIIVTHDQGYQSLYAHLSAISVSRGQQVVQGAVIGKVGNTGYSTGSHLHFSVYKNGKTIDPRSVLN